MLQVPVFQIVPKIRAFSFQAPPLWYFACFTSWSRWSKNDTPCHVCFHGQWNLIRTKLPWLNQTCFKKYYHHYSLTNVFVSHSSDRTVSPTEDKSMWEHKSTYILKTLQLPTISLTVPLTASMPYMSQMFTSHFIQNAGYSIYQMAFPALVASQFNSRYRWPAVSLT